MGVHGFPAPEAAKDRRRLLEAIHPLPRGRIVDAVGSPLPGASPTFGPHPEAQVEAPTRKVIDGDCALGQPRRVMRGRIEAIRHRRSEASVPGDHGHRPEHRPAIMGPGPEAVTVSDAGVTHSSATRQ